MLCGTALLAGVGCVAGGFLAPEAFWPAWLTSTIFWLGVSLGSLGVAVLHRVTTGRWGFAFARELHASIGAIPVGIVAAALLTLGAAHVFPWATEEGLHGMNHNQQIYFSAGFFIPRLIAYVVIWGGLALWMLGSYRRHVDQIAPARGTRIASFGLILVFGTVSFAVVDGMQSLSPGWVSSLYGLLQLLGFAVAAMAVLLVIRGFIAPSPVAHLLPPEPAEGPGIHDAGYTGRLHPQVAYEFDRSHDLANLMQAFNMLWAYMAFSQYLIIWSGDLPHEVDWYLVRRTGAGGIISTLLFALHFVVPFGMLLSKARKRNPQRAAVVAALLAVMCLVDIGWNVIPSTPAHGPIVGVLVLASWLAIGSVWMLRFGSVYSRLVYVPPEIDEAHPETNEQQLSHASV